jgi:5-deoxy-glucuronate isomerase
VLELPAGGAHSWTTDEDEMLVLPLAGSATVTCETDGAAGAAQGGAVEKFTVQGRRDVFSRVTDFVYLPREATVTVTAEGGPGRFALPAARCTRRLPARYGPAEEVPVELRGAGQASRQVNNFCTPEAFDCDKLIAVEVLTPGGNTSSYPPHKHDEAGPAEVELEEIYYFETRGLGYHRVYGTAERPIDVLAEVRSGDVVLVPHGWHGPSVALPGYDLYYLNVMAGPAAERRWRFSDDPDHAWVRESWRDQRVDPRLPMTSWSGEPTQRAEWPAELAEPSAEGVRRGARP